MVCDIHLVLERRHNDKWIAVNTFESHHNAYAAKGAVMGGWSSPAARTRNYIRFAALANVRGDGPEPRGLPEGISETTQYLVEKWGGDGHSHSWLPLKEAADLFLKTHGPQSPSEWAQKFPESYFFGADSEDGEFRVVFWFDN